jgi:hypothetical protein
MPDAIMDIREFPKGIDERLEELSRSRTQLLQEIEAAKTVGESGSLGSNAWSVAEVVYHLHLSEKSIARGLKKALDSTSRSPAVCSEQLRAEWELIRKLIGTRRAKVQAPPRVVPANPPDLADGVELLRQSRQQLLDAVQNATYDDLLSVSMPHPFQAVGTLTGAGWLSVVAYHELRHAEQIRELSSARKSQSVQPTEA